MSLTINVADPAVYMISGLLPLEAEIHTKVFTMFGNITRAHKNSTEWKLAERQLHIKNAKNYRGITVTPTLSKIIEKILKIRENGKILLNQNPLQKGFTKNSSPLLCELLVEEFERENKDLKRPTYIAMLDAKSAFDVVVHANLIRRLHQYEFSDQSILLINSLYENAVSHIKWKNLMSEQNFKIERCSTSRTLKCRPV